MARGAVVVILSDGWERGDPTLVGREMERLRRLAHRIVWVNPRVSAPGFVPRAGGMVAALPHATRWSAATASMRWTRWSARSAPSGEQDLVPRARTGIRDRAGGGAVAERDAGPRQLGGDAERLRPEPGQDDSGVVAGVMSGADSKICIYPGCDRPAVPPHPLGGPAAQLLRPGGAQRADAPTRSASGSARRQTTDTRRMSDG